MTYIEFLNNIIKQRGQWGISKEEYFEMHHIIPRCLGGTGDNAKDIFYRNSKNSNCIWLYPEEHYIAHKLLAEENPNNNKLIYAWHRISLCKKQFLTKEAYAELKRMRRIIGLTKEHKQKIAQSHEGKKCSWLSVWNTETKKGIKLSEETRLKMKIAQTKGNNNHAKRVINLDTGEEFSCMVDAAKSVNANVGGFSLYLNNSQKAGITKCKGYRWKYK